MRFQNWMATSGKSIVLLVGFVFATELAWQIYKKYGSSKKKKQNNINASKPIAEALFFSEQSALCRTHVNYNIPCSMSTCPIINLNKIIEYISSATRSVDVCAYFLTCNVIAKAIIDTHRRKIIVRIITDNESTENDASQIFNLRKAGIRVRSKKFAYLMHHKFVIIDRKILITGSANWTVQAFFGNYENVLITNQNELVSAYLNEYEKLWLKFNSEFNTEVQNGMSI